MKQNCHPKESFLRDFFSGKQKKVVYNAENEKGLHTNIVHMFYCFSGEKCDIL